MSRMNRRRLPFLALAPLLAFGWGAADAQDTDQFDRTPQQCLSTSSIDRTRVLDDRTILFFMRGKRIYRNYLPRKCPGLEREQRIMYKTQGSRLCDIDTITVLEEWGGRLTPGFTCPLGSFVPITAEEVEDLMRSPDVPRNAIESEAVNLPADEDADPPATGEAAAGEPDGAAAPR